MILIFSFFFFASLILGKCENYQNILTQSSLSLKEIPLNQLAPGIGKENSLSSLKILSGNVNIAKNIGIKFSFSIHNEFISLF